MSNLYLGVDVSKGYADVAVLDETGKPHGPMQQYLDIPSGHEGLSRQVDSLLQTAGVTQVLAAVESTGGYENNWMALFSRLSAAGVAIRSARLNPRQPAHFSKSSLTRTVTDKVSAETIAEYVRCGHDKLRFDETDDFKSLRRLWSSRELLQKAYKAQLQYIQMILYDCNPSVLQHMRKYKSRWILEIVSRYPTARELGRARVSTLMKIPHVTQERATTLIAQAKTSVAADTAPETSFLVRQSIAAIRDLEKRIAALEKQLRVFAGEHPQTSLITSIPGIGLLSAVGLLINIGNVHRFPKAKHITSYFGLHPVFKQSGDGKTVARMCKQGRAEPRAILFMASLSAVRVNPILRKTYADACAQGKSPKVAIGICMHKLLRIVYGILKSGLPFDAAIHAQHYARRAEQEQKNAPKENAPAFDMCAPVSYRTAKKRGGKSGPQNAQVALCAGSPSPQ